MRFTRHFYNNWNRGRSYITEEMCLDIVDDPVDVQVHRNGCIQHWGQVDLFGDGKLRFLKVVTTPTRDSVVTAHLDSNFRRKFMRTRR